MKTKTRFALVCAFVLLGRAPALAENWGYNDAQSGMSYDGGGMTTFSNRDGTYGWRQDSEFGSTYHSNNKNCWSQGSSIGVTTTSCQ